MTKHGVSLEECSRGYRKGSLEGQTGKRFSRLAVSKEGPRERTRTLKRGDKRKWGWMGHTELRASIRTAAGQRKVMEKALGGYENTLKDGRVETGEEN